MRKPLVNVSCTNVQKTVVHAHCSVWGWAVSIDLKHAYLHVPIPVLFLMARPTNTVFPFGLTTNPHVYTRVVKAEVGQVCLSGV